MRVIKASKIVEEVSKLAISANLFFPDHLTLLLRQSLKKEESSLAKQAISAILNNIKIAGTERLPLCQDTGMVSIFLRIGSEVKVDLENFTSLSEVASKGVEEGYRKGYFRKSISQPLSRQILNEESPILYIEIISGDRFDISLLVRGFGAENLGRVTSFSPTAKMKEIEDFILEAINKRAINACPPIFLGLGFGGTTEKALLLSKEALLEMALNRKRERSPEDKILQKLEKDLFKKINKLGIGPAGLGGKATILGVRAKSFPTHIAGLPLGISISCWALRAKAATI